jgi:hypothetical protein
MLIAKHSQKNDDDGPCQSPELLESTKYYPRILTRLRLLLWYARREGALVAFNRIAKALGSELAPAEYSGPTPSARTLAVEEVLNLQPGEWIEVKSRDEILQTLDVHAKNRGLRFVPEMFDFCGRRFRVLKRVEKICIENTPDVRRIRNTVLLEGGLCNGGGIGCDRACFHFWREVWLRRVAEKHSVH